MSIGYGFFCDNVQTDVYNGVKVRGEDYIIMACKHPELLTELVEQVAYMTKASCVQRRSSTSISTIE